MLCECNHHIDDCKEYLAKPLEDRKLFAREKGLCFGCLDQGHLARSCVNRRTCSTCHRMHPSSLHGDIPVRTEGTLDKSLSMMVQNGNCSKSSMIVPVWLSHKDKPSQEILVYALLDTQSDTTFILDSTRRKLKIGGQDVNLLLSTMSCQDELIASKRINGLRVRGHSETESIWLPTTYTRDIMPANRSHIPTPEMAVHWPHLQPMVHHLMPVSECEIGLLIGYNSPRSLAPMDVIPPVDEGPYAQRTALGWGIVGVIDSNGIEQDAVGVSHRILASMEGIQIASSSKIREIISPNEIVQFMQQDFSETQGNPKHSVSVEDQKFIQKLSDGITKDTDGHYQMPLPFREDPSPILPNNKAMALSRLNQLKRKMQRNDVFRKDYQEFMSNLFSQGYAEEVGTTDVNDSVWYIPHHGVYHPMKPNKIRIVFDCSARYQGDALNDHLLQGPDLTNGLVGVLCRFRQEAIALMCDVEAMFHQFRVQQEHRRYLRFLWWKDGDIESKPTEFHMNVHIFGATSSPGCANFGLKTAADDSESRYGPQTANFIRRNFYVDDGLKSVPGAAEAIQLALSSIALCAESGMRLHKFIANSREVIAAIPAQYRAKEVMEMDLDYSTLPIERALGIQWCIESDTFRFRITLKDKPLTRRGILSTVCSIYDPLGLVAPIVLLGKQILQELCRESTEWDEPLSDHIIACWDRWRNSLQQLEEVRIN